MKKAKILLIALLILCVALAAVACNPTETPDPTPDGPDTPDTPDTPDVPDTPDTPDTPVEPKKCLVEWINSTNYKLTTEDGTDLTGSVEVEEGTTLKFKVVVTNSTMGVTKVVAGDDTLTADANGVYAVTVNDDITVSALVQKLAITSIAVTQEPTKKEYFAGDKLDPAGMVVTATYNNGTTEAITSYTVKYAYGEALSTGDTSVTIVVGELECAVTGLSVRDHVPFTNVAVSLTAVEGKPVLSVTGTLGDATMAILEIKGCGKHNATLNGKDFAVTIDLATVIASAKGGDWLDLKLFHSANDYIDLSESQTADMNAVVVYEGRKYFFASYESALKIVWEDAEPFKALSTTLEVVDGNPTLKVVGTLGTAPNAKLDIKGCGQYDAIYNGKDFTITVNLVNALASSKAGDWLDLKLYYGESYTDLYKDQATNYEASFISAGRRYFFASWGPSDDAPQALKIVWEETGVIEDLAVTLEDVAGVPTLKVTGVLGSAEFAKLEIKDCGQYEATYGGANNREFTISVNLATALANAEQGSWLDLKLFYKADAYNDLTTSDVTDYQASVMYEGRNYLFANWEGALKIMWKAYSAKASVEIVGDKAVVTITGQVDPSLAGTDSGIKGWYGVDIAFTGSVDETGAFVYTYEFDENASADTMWLHKYVNGSKEDDLRGTIVAGKESVTIGNKVITLSNAGGALTVVVTEA